MSEILIIDDMPANIQLLVELIGQENHIIRPTTNPEFALQSAIASPPDLILLDINMPDINGFELCQAFKQEPPPLCNVPIIFISARSDTESILQGFRVGGVDYISKPFNQQEVLARVRTQLELQERRREVERLHRREVAQLTQMNQLKDDVLRLVSHDLRAPLSVIHACSELLSETESLQQDENAHSLIEQILNSVGDMNQFLYDLLDMVQAEGRLNLDLKTISAVEYLSTIVEKYRFQAQKKELQFEFVVGGDGPYFIRVDEARFEQVIQNLLTNALKYTPAGGRITLKVNGREAEVDLSIQDSGLGIPEAALPYLFDKFYRVDAHLHQQETGTGLGLAIAKALTEQHHGRLSVQSIEGQGSTFTITLPRQEPPAVSPPTPPNI